MDERMRKCNEAFQSIKLIKMYAWERVFQGLIEETRGEELRLLLQAAFLRIASGNMDMTLSTIPMPSLPFCSTYGFA